MKRRSFMLAALAGFVAPVEALRRFTYRGTTVGISGTRRVGVAPAFEIGRPIKITRVLIINDEMGPLPRG